MIAVAGAGASGIAVARHAVSLGKRVVLYDESEESVLRERIKNVLPPGVEIVRGLPGLEYISDTELVVLSPGIPAERLPLSIMEEYGIEVIGEIEYAFRNLEGEFVGITGTNGKSTVTSIVGLALEKCYGDVFIGGNLKDPLTLACFGEYGRYVVELSSFQLETVKTFRPKVAVILNVGEDHLDRYDSIEEYAEAKAKVFANQEEDDFLVYNADDSIVSRMVSGARSRKLSFSMMGKAGADAVFSSGVIEVAWEGMTYAFPVSEMKMKGMHNVENAMASILASLAAGVDFDAVAKVLREFPGLPHRMEFVADVRGVRFFNDSKGTNVHALESALKGVEGPVILIAGGKDKGLSFGSLADVVREKVKSMVLIGETAERISSELGHVVEAFRVGSMDEAVRKAYDLAKPGDLVLLSPGCSSFDMFSSFEERGEVFKNAVRRLALEQES